MGTALVASAQARTRGLDNSALQSPARLEGRVVFGGSGARGSGKLLVAGQFAGSLPLWAAAASGPRLSPRMRWSVTVWKQDIGKVFKAIVTWIRQESAATQTLITAFIALGISFQWWHWSNAETGAVVGITAALLGMFVRSQVTPLIRPRTSERRLVPEGESPASTVAAAPAPATPAPARPAPGGPPPRGNPAGGTNPGGEPPPPDFGGRGTSGMPPGM